MTVMMSDNSEKKCLKFKIGFSSAIVIFILSIFCHILNWYLYDKYGSLLEVMVISPLIFCMMYHFVQLDAGKQGEFYREFFFMCAVGAPCILSLIMFFITLDFESEVGSLRYTISAYSARIMLTSVYLIIFALIDIPILRHIDKKKKKDWKEKN